LCAACATGDFYSAAQNSMVEANEGGSARRCLPVHYMYTDVVRRGTSVARDPCFCWRAIKKLGLPTREGPAKVMSEAESKRHKEGDVDAAEEGTTLPPQTGAAGDASKVQRARDKAALAASEGTNATAGSGLGARTEEREETAHGEDVAGEDAAGDVEGVGKAATRGFTFEEHSSRLKVVEGSADSGATFYTFDGKRCTVGAVVVSQAVGWKRALILRQGQVLPLSLALKNSEAGDVLLWVLQHTSNHTVSAVVWNPAMPDEFRQLAMSKLQAMVVAVA
jgi:hypothetical protein